MRVVAGQFRGRILKSPSWDGLRPTSDRLRETLFSILGGSVGGARVLDGYAGTGAIGIEALSRGAAHVTFVERDPRAVRLIEMNLGLLGLRPPSSPTSERVRPRGRRSPPGAEGSSSEGGGHAIIRAGLADATTRLAGSAFDLLILDPPYADRALEDALTAAAPLVGRHATLVIEHAARHAPPPAHGGLHVRRTVKAGDSALSFYGF
jgi:16S rRNA (guanine966-N2)-methyltransferase